MENATRSTIEAGRAALAQFKKTGKLDFPEDMTHNDYAVWRCIFESNLVAWKITAIHEVQKNAKKTYEMYVKSPSDLFLNTVAMVAHSSTKCYCTEINGIRKKKWCEMFDGLYPEVVKIWEKQFSEFPKFQEYFDKMKDF